MFTPNQIRYQQKGIKATNRNDDFPIANFHLIVFVREKVHFIHVICCLLPHKAHIKLNE